jgi:hypothetical protein
MNRAVVIIVLIGLVKFCLSPRAVWAEGNTFEAHGVTLQWTNLNATLSVDLRTGAVQRNLSLSGQLQFPADRSYAAYIVQPESVTDASGRKLMEAKPSRWSTRSSSPPIQRLQMGPGQGGTQGVSLSLNNLRGQPSAIRSIRGSIHLLQVTAQREVDLPLEPGEQWTDIAEGVKVRVEKVQKQSQNFTVQYEFSGTDPQAMMELDSSPFVMMGLPLDAEGKPLPLRSPPYHYNSGSNRATVRFYMSSEKAEPKQLRLVLATETAERELEFDLTDLPDWTRGGEDKPKP